MKCSKCKNKLFKIKFKDNCEDCHENGAFDSDIDKYIFDEKIINKKGLIRNHVKHEGECNFSTAFEFGCWMIFCSKCGHRTNIPKITD